MEGMLNWTYSKRIYRLETWKLKAPNTYTQQYRVSDKHRSSLAPIFHTCSFMFFKTSKEVKDFKHIFRGFVWLLMPFQTMLLKVPNVYGSGFHLLKDTLPLSFHACVTRHGLFFFYFKKTTFNTLNIPNFGNTCARIPVWQTTGARAQKEHGVSQLLWLGDSDSNVGYALMTA